MNKEQRIDELLETVNDPNNATKPHEHRHCPICEDARLVTNHAGIHVCEDGCAISIDNRHPHMKELCVGAGQFRFFNNHDHEDHRHVMQDALVLIDHFKAIT